MIHTFDSIRNSYGKDPFITRAIKAQMAQPKSTVSYNGNTWTILDTQHKNLTLQMHTHIWDRPLHRIRMLLSSLLKTNCKIKFENSVKLLVSASETVAKTNQIRHHMDTNSNQSSAQQSQRLDLTSMTANEWKQVKASYQQNPSLKYMWGDTPPDNFYSLLSKYEDWDIFLNMYDGHDIDLFNMLEQLATKWGQAEPYSQEKEALADIYNRFMIAFINQDRFQAIPKNAALINHLNSAAFENLLYNDKYFHIGLNSNKTATLFLQAFDSPEATSDQRVFLLCLFSARADFSKEFIKNLSSKRLKEAYQAFQEFQSRESTWIRDAPFTSVMAIKNDNREIYFFNRLLTMFYNSRESTPTLQQAVNKAIKLVKETYPNFNSPFLLNKNNQFSGETLLEPAFVKVDALRFLKTLEKQ